MTSEGADPHLHARVVIEGMARVDGPRRGAPPDRAALLIAINRISATTMNCGALGSASSTNREGREA